MSVGGTLEAGPVLLADIGGTNARLGLLDGQRVVERANLSVAQHESPRAAIANYLGCLETARRPVAALLAVAGPVEGGRARLTNADWSFNAAELARVWGFPVRLANDFEAQAWAAETLDESERMRIGSGETVSGAPLAVLGPGTGLGVAGFLPGAKGRPGCAIVGEGGHVTLSPRNASQAEMLAALLQRYDHVSAERLVSGPGLVLLSQILAGGVRKGFDSPEDLVAAARSGEVLARETLAVFFDLLGNVAGNIALTFGARGGVYLTGGILPSLKAELASSAFRQAFEAKGRMQNYLASIPCFLVLADDPAFAGLHAMAKAWLATEVET
jgi:glucokinase